MEEACCKLGDHHRRSVGLLLAFGGFLQTRFYNNAAKNFGAEGILCRWLENLDRKVIYKACESSYVISTSAWVYFFEKSFPVPKIMPKVCSEGCTLIVPIMIQVIRGAVRPILGTLNRIGVYGVILVHQILFRTRPLSVLINPLIQPYHILLVYCLFAQRYGKFCRYAIVE